jgi:parallel beta-helix repeat protein
LLPYSGMNSFLRARLPFVFGLVLSLALAVGCTRSISGGGGGGDDVPERAEDALSKLIDAAPDGGTVLVPEGHYHEQVEITKPLTLMPAGEGDVMVDGDCKRNFGINVPTGSDVTISGITISNTIGAGVMIGNGDEDDPLPSHVTVDSMTIYNFDCEEGDVQYQSGIAVWNAACCITLTNNEITYRYHGDAHGRGDGIWFKSNSEKPSGGGHHIADNTIVGGWDGIGGENEDDPHGTFDGNTTVEGNHISNCWDDGIQVEGGDENVRVQDNEIEGCGTGIAFAPAMTGPLYVEHNYIHDLRLGLYENLFCYKIGNEGAGTVYLRENLCRTDGDGLLQTNEGITPVVSEGNCYDVTRYVMETDGELPDGSSFDKDVMWTTDPDRFIKWGEIRYDTIAEFTSATGFEANGVNSEECPLDLGGE